jgi:hypothetical protein
MTKKKNTSNVVLKANEAALIVSGLDNVRLLLPDQKADKAQPESIIVAALGWIVSTPEIFDPLLTKFLDHLDGIEDGGKKTKKHTCCGSCKAKKKKKVK